MSDPHATDDRGEDLFFEREGGEPESIDVDPSGEMFEVVSSAQLDDVAQWVPSHADDAAPAIYPPARRKHSPLPARLIPATGALLVVVAGGWLYFSGNRQQPGSAADSATDSAAAPGPVTTPKAPSAPTPAPSTPAPPAAASVSPVTPAASSRAAQLPPPRSAQPPVADSPRPSIAAAAPSTATVPPQARPDARTASRSPETSAPLPDERRARIPAEPAKTSPPAAIDTGPAAAETAAALPPVRIVPPPPAPSPARTVEDPPVIAIGPPPATPIAPSAAPPVVAAEDALRAVLDRYRSAYGRLDAAAAHEVYPRIDTRALSRAFDQLAMQEIDFAACDFRVNGDRAAAGCTGVARFVTKVGNKTPRIESRFWNFDFRKSGQSWRIEKIELR